MTAIHTVSTQLKRWALGALVVALAVGLGAAPALAQDNGSADKQKMEALKKAYSEGMQAAKQNNHQVAYPRLQEALRLARETDQSGAASQISDVLHKLPKKWGNQALKDKNYSEALTHFEAGVEYASDDAYMYYGKGLALVNMDSTDAAMASMSRAVEVGQETGDTRTANTASERIRQEFVSRASKALSKQNPSTADANEALEALDQMREYVEPNAKSLFYRASAQYAKGEFQSAIETARQGLEMHRGSRTDAAKYHFVIAESQLNAGDKASACATFEQSAYGDYKARSEHYLENTCE